MYDNMLTLDELTAKKGGSAFSLSFKNMHGINLHRISTLKEDYILNEDIKSIISMAKNKTKRKALPRSKRSAYKPRKYKVSQKYVRLILGAYIRALTVVVANTLINGDRFIFANSVLSLHIRRHKMNYYDNLTKGYRYVKRLRGFMPLLNVSVGKNYYYYKGKTSGKIKTMFWLEGGLHSKLSAFIEEKHMSGEVFYTKKNFKEFKHAKK